MRFSKHLSLNVVALLAVLASCKGTNAARDILDRSAKASQNGRQTENLNQLENDNEGNDGSTSDNTADSSPNTQNGKGTAQTGDAPDITAPGIPPESTGSNNTSPGTVKDPSKTPPDMTQTPPIDTGMPKPPITAFDKITPIPQGKTIRIMPLGASITQGVGGTKAGYRTVIHRLLDDAKIPHVFVGSSKEQPGGLPADQQNHEGHPGWVISTIPGGSQGIQEQLGKWIPAAKPDYVLILVGSNDIAQSFKLDEIGNRIEKLIDTVNNKQTGLAKDATVIIASLPPIKDARQETDSKKFRDKIMAIVVKQKTAGNKVGYIDVNGALKAEHMTDNLHPNDSGFEVIGKMWIDRMMGK